LFGYIGSDNNGRVTNTVLRSSQTNGIWFKALFLAGMRLLLQVMPQIISSMPKAFQKLIYPLTIVFYCLSFPCRNSGAGAEIVFRSSSLSIIIPATAYASSTSSGGITVFAIRLAK
jgi:hypothetical protein